MAAFPQIWTLYLLGLLLSIRAMYCLKAFLFLFRAELYSTSSSSHGFHSSATNGAPSLTPPRSKTWFHSVNYTSYFFGSISYSSDKNNGCSFLFFAEVTRWCVALFLHHPVNAGDYFIAEEHIISGIQRKCHICKNNKKKQLSFWYFHFLLLAQVTIVRLISVYFVPRTLVYITRTPAYNWLTNCLS